MSSTSSVPNNKPLYLILFLFLIPPILAYVLFYATGYAHRFHKSRGLLQQHFHMPELESAQWNIVKLPTKTHEPALEMAIEKRWQALGKDQKRAHLLTIIPSLDHDQHSPSSPWQALTLPEERLHMLLSSIQCQTKPCYYAIFDPRGNAVTAYGSGFEAKDLDYDLRKLLKYTPDIKKSV